MEVFFIFCKILDKNGCFNLLYKSNIGGIFMGTQKYILTEDSIIESSVPVGEFRKYFKKTIGNDYDKNFVNFQKWLNSNTGKTVKKAVEGYYKELDANNGDKLIGEIVEDIGQLLKEDRFNYISKENKKFINEFTKQLKLFGYGFGGQIGGGFCWGNNMIIYSQTGVKNEKVIARIYIRDKGVIIWGGKENNYENSIVLRLFFDNINKHTEYIERTPSHIKSLFVNDQGICPYICDHYSEKCHNRKIYSINGKQIEKCGYYFSITDPKTEHIKDYIDILKEFHVKKLSKK